MKNQIMVKEQKITSMELVQIINQFRNVEGNKAELQHTDFTKKINKEIETLKTLGLNSLGNFSESTYKNSRGKIYPCFELNRDGMLQMLNSESTFCRYKTIEYVNKLENKIIDNIKIDNKIIKQSKYLTSDIFDKKSTQRYIQNNSGMKIRETIEKIKEIVIPMKGEVKHIIIDAAIKELKVIDAEMIENSAENTYIKKVIAEGIIDLQDIKINKYKRKIYFLS